MRLLVNCPSGESRLLQVRDECTVLELKQLLLEEEGIPIKQQVLCYAGQHLQDSVPLADHHLEEYTLSNEVVLYLTRVLEEPKMVFLCSRCKPSQRVPEMVEANMPVGEARHLLVSRNMAGLFPPNAPILAKRHDGTTILLSINPMEGLTELLERIARHEGVEPDTMTFNQAQDGALHIHVSPSADSLYGPQSKNCYSVYKRSVLPQPIMPNMTDLPEGKSMQPLPELSKELCVLP